MSVISADRAAELLTLAERVAREAHQGQVDKSGVPYIEHPRAVASMVEDPIDKIIAWLHDTVEDTPVTIDYLTSLGFPSEVTDAVDALTKRRSETLYQYATRVVEYPRAVRVKKADIRHNADPERLAGLPIDVQVRLEVKYGQTSNYLGTSLEAIRTQIVAPYAFA